MKTDTILLLKNKIPYLNPALRRIGEYILLHPNECRTITIKDLALACEVAESTVTRFVKEIGFKNFQELKIGLTQSLSTQDLDVPMIQSSSAIYEDISIHDETKNIIDKIFYKNIQKMELGRDLIHIPSLETAVSYLQNTNKIFFTATGSSSIAAEEAVMRFTRAGKVCIFWKDYSLQLMTSSIIEEGDVIIAISDSGRTKLVNESMMLAKENGAKLIGITSDSESTLAKLSDVFLLTPERMSKTQSALHWESTSSKAAQILVIDTLYACFAVKNFDRTLQNLDKTYKAIRQTRES